jgi:hypothetical protein
MICFSLRRYHSVRSIAGVSLWGLDEFMAFLEDADAYGPIVAPLRAEEVKFVDWNIHTLFLALFCAALVKLQRKAPSFSRK